MDTVVLDGASVDRDFAPGVLKFTAWPEQPHLVLSMARFNTKLLATYSVNVEHTSVSTCHRPERTLIREHVWLSTGSAYIECHPLVGVWTLLLLFYAIVKMGLLFWPSRCRGSLWRDHSTAPVAICKQVWPQRGHEYSIKHCFVYKIPCFIIPSVLVRPQAIIHEEI